MGERFYNHFGDPFNGDAIPASGHVRIQSAYYSGPFKNITVSASANYPFAGGSTRYFIWLPIIPDMSDLVSRPILLRNVTGAANMTRVTGSPAANQFRVAQATSRMPQVIELNAAQAGQVIGFDFYGDGSVINAENYVQMEGNGVYPGEQLWFDNTKGALRAGLDSTGGNWTDAKTGNASAAFGTDTEAQGNSSFACGYESRAIDSYSHAEGDTTTAEGASSHSEGDTTLASGDASHAEGGSTTASGVSSHAEGSSTTASGASSHAEGSLSAANGISSHAEGYSTIANSDYSHAEGDDTNATAAAAHAEGDTTTASGAASHAQGNACESNGANSDAMGYRSKTTRTSGHAHGNGYIAAVGDAQYERWVDPKTVAANGGTAVSSLSIPARGVVGGWLIVVQENTGSSTVTGSSFTVQFSGRNPAGTAGVSVGTVVHAGNVPSADASKLVVDASGANVRATLTNSDASYAGRVVFVWMFGYVNFP